MMSGDRATYLDRLRLYYEEEIEGEAYFAELSQRFPGRDQRRKLGLLARVERHAAGAMVPLIEKYRLSPRAPGDLRADGQAAARATPADWPALLAGMRDSYPGYVDAFRELEDMAPPEDRPRLAFLTRHELAALEFLALEATRPEHSSAPLTAYLAQHPDPGGRDRSGP